LEIYLIRHAQSTNQVLDNRDDIVFDPHLTDLGHQQADHLARFFGAGEESVRFAESRVDRLVCSPMWRALQTARPLAETLHLQPEVWVDVHEQVLTSESHPGSSREEILTAFPGYHLPDEVTAEGWWRGGQETHWDCMRRALQVADRLQEQADDGDEHIAIVSHARFLDSLLKALQNQLPSHRSWYHHSNTAVSRIALPEGRLELRYLNRVSHLPPDLVS
jgi:broad specificity phosphatase PhoE